MAMKTRFLYCLSILSCLATNAQIKDPVWNQRFAEERDDKHTIPVFSGKAEPDSPGFDSTWASQFQSTLDEVIQNNTAKGASVAVYTPEEGLWTGVSGISYEGVPITRDMRFGIGSNTKLFVAVALLKLQEQGKLTLDDHLYQWLPSIPHVDSSATIRQLLSHQTGIWDYWNDEPSLLGQLWSDTSRFWTTDEVLASLGSPHFSPGNGFSYSNTNYMLAGLIMEAATGKSWVQNLHELIFDPLSLDSTFVGAFEPSNGPVAAEWDTYNNILIINSPMTAEFSQAHANGAIMSTASEMVQWYYALFNGSVISNASLQELLDFEPMSLYGLGIYVSVKDEKLIYNHSGGPL
jgi:D-alanyl-D-alanine carboxypeptidase